MFLKAENVKFHTVGGTISHGWRQTAHGWRHPVLFWGLDPAPRWGLTGSRSGPALGEAVARRRVQIFKSMVLGRQEELGEAPQLAYGLGEPYK